MRALSTLRRAAQYSRLEDVPLDSFHFGYFCGLTDSIGSHLHPDPLLLTLAHNEARFLAYRYAKIDAFNRR